MAHACIPTIDNEPTLTSKILYQFYTKYQWTCSVTNPRQSYAVELC